MSLRAPIVYCLPEDTARVARAAFPRGNPYLRMYDVLGPLFAGPDFADLYPEDGQPAGDPDELALVTIFQFSEGLSDRQAADAVRGRMDWKYALCLLLEDEGFDASVLSEFRSRLIAGGAERRS
jgi:transposase